MTQPALLCDHCSRPFADSDERREDCAYGCITCSECGEGWPGEEKHEQRKA